MKQTILSLALILNSFALLAQYDIVYDSTFSNDGIVLLPYSITALKGVFVQSDDKAVVICEKREIPDSPVFTVLRLNVNGTLDVSYNNSGINNSPTLFSKTPYPTALLLPNNDLIVGGTTPTSLYPNSIVLHKYKEDGTMDNLFGNGGALILTEDSVDLYCTSLARYNDTSFLALYGGYAYSASTFNGKNILCKINENGRIDSSFAVNGKLELPFTLLTTTEKVVLSPDGSLYILGSYNLDFKFYYLVIKLNPDLSIASGFQFESHDDYSYLQDIDVDEDGKVIVVASRFDQGFIMWRLMPDGSLDTSFSKDGILDENLNFSTFGPNQIIEQPDGKILLSSSGGASSMRVNPNGTMDYSFDLDGVADILPNSDVLHNYVNSSGWALQKDGKMIFLAENESDFIKVIRVKTRP